jgi:hypothetical protein
MTALTTTRAVLRRRVATLLEDITEMTATANGLTTTFIDTIRLGNSIERATGREIMFTSGANLGTSRRVTTSDMTTGTLTFAAVTSTVAGDTAEMYNFRLEGWISPQYHNALDMAIDQAWPLFGTKVTVAAAAVFSTTTTLIDIPSGIDQLESVEYQDTSSLWQEVKQADGRYGVGWSVEADGTDVVIRGENWRDRLQGRSIRLVGYTRATVLATDAATTTIPPEWIVYKAASILCLAKKRSPEIYNQGLVYREDAEKLEGRVRTRRKGRPVMVTP